MYTFSLKLGGETYEGTGATPLEALQAVPRPPKFTTKGILTISHGELKKQLLFMPARLKRMFYPNAQRVLVKWLAAGLK